MAAGMLSGEGSRKPRTLFTVDMSSNKGIGEVCGMEGCGEGGR
jgi:hypothetical protein